MPFWNSLSINYELLKNCQNRQYKKVTPSLSSAGELLLPSENIEFRWSITGFILKASSVLLSFLLSAKCRFWRFWKISQERFRIIVLWIPSLPIRLSSLQYSAIVGNLLIGITKFIPRNAFSSSLVVVNFLPFWWA